MTAVKLFSAATGTIDGMTMELSGSLDFDQDIIDLRTAGTVATDEDGAKLRVHTDGYKIKLASKFAIN